MTTTFHIEASELNNSFLDKIHLLFQNKKLVITVEEEMDTTDYLLSTESDREKFQQSIKELEEGNIITVRPEDLRK